MIKSGFPETSMHLVKKSFWRGTREAMKSKNLKEIYVYRHTFAKRKNKNIL
jgi:hypothetical protein